MAYTTYRGRRVSKAHATILRAYEAKYGVAVQLNQGARTMDEQRYFWNRYQRYGHPVAAYPSPSAPHIKYGMAHHALDINAGYDPGEAQHVAGFYRSLGISVAFNVRSEAWHMDVLDRRALKRAAKKLRGPRILKRGSKGKAVVTLKKLLYRKGIRDFSGKNSSNRYKKYFGYWTQKAVKRFQKRRGLKADGVVGRKTWRKLR